VCLGWAAATGRAQPAVIGPSGGGQSAPAGPAPVNRAPATNLPELKCHLYTREAVLDYEFRFVAPFWVSIPLKRLYGGGRRLSITTWVRPISVEGAEDVRSEDNFVLPKEVPPGAKGDFELGGSLAFGEGVYEINWELKDEAGRACRVGWKLEAKLPRRARDVPMALDPGEVAPAAVYLFRPERGMGGGETRLRVKVLVNLDVPYQRRRARVQLWRFVPMISGLRVMSRHPALDEFSVVAFSLEEQEVFHRHGFSKRIDFPALGKAVASLTPGIVEVNDLRRGSDLAFLDELLAEELTETEGVDAIVFVGADDRFGKRVSPATIERFREARVPVFHFNSTPYLWRGAIGNAVKSVRGTEFRVRQPYELAAAVDKLVEEILEQRAARRPGKVAPPGVSPRGLLPH
jgi:hypothetical protein